VPPGMERDPELRIAKDGTLVIEFSLAVNTKRCVEDITIWLFCYAWGSQAETIQRSVTKGSILFVQGHFTPHQSHCLTRNLTLRSSRNTLSADHVCMFKQTTASQFPLAKKTGSTGFALQEADSC
jgi:primosomal replication protein N